MFFDPLNAGFKVSARLKVRVVPFPAAEELAVFTEHWLFWSVPLVPNVTGPCHTVPASLAR